MDTLISKAKVVIPGLGWRLWQSLAFSAGAGLVVTFFIWLEAPVLKDMIYFLPVWLSCTFSLTPWFFVYSLYYEGRRKKWMAGNS